MWLWLSKMPTQNFLMLLKLLMLMLRKMLTTVCLRFFPHMFDFLQICVRNAKTVCKIPHMFIFADIWLFPNMFGKKETHWYIYTWVLFSTQVWILTHRYGKRHTCVKKATQLYVCKCLAFSTHVWEKPLTCLFPPELWVCTNVFKQRQSCLPSLLALCLRALIFRFRCACTHLFSSESYSDKGKH